MDARCGSWFSAVAALLIVFIHPAFALTTRTVIAEARYVMADGDTLASAEEKVLQRAQ